MELACLDENLQRDDYTALERVQAIARRKSIYETLHPQTTHGGDRRSSSHPENLKPTFAEATAAQTGAGVSTVLREAAIGANLDPVAAATIATVPAVADNKNELERLSRMPAAEQKKAAKAIKTGKAKTVSEAVAPVTVEGRMAISNKRLDDFARKITSLAAEAERLGEPHLSDSGRLAILEGQLKAAAATVRVAKGAGVCRYCGGTGCVRCYKTGWLCKMKLESAPEAA
jgi:hypothetical protein